MIKEAEAVGDTKGKDEPRTRSKAAPIQSVESEASGGWPRSESNVLGEPGQPSLSRTVKSCQIRSVHATGESLARNAHRYQIPDGGWK